MLIVLGAGSKLKAQEPFSLYPSGNTQEFFKYVTKDYNVNGTIYHTGLINLSGYKKITSGTTGTFYNTQAPVQKLQLTGGNILLCRSNDSPTYPGFNPTSRNGAILFGDNIQTGYDFIHGKWGIEYDDQYSTGGLNFFKPKSSLTATRINHTLFIRNDGYIGINTAMPLTRLHVDGELTVTALASRDKLVSADATGKLILVDKPDGDNMGNCIPGFNIKLGTKSISFDGTSAGLSVDIKNNILVSDNLYIANSLVVGNTIYGKPFTEDNYKLQLNGSIHTDAAKIELCDGHADYWRSAKFLVQGPTADYQFFIDNATAFKFSKTVMTVGNSESLMNLRVNGKIDANEVKVSLNHWNDYVFQDDFKLMPLSELELFVNANKHLPEIPTEKEVLNDGINVGEMNALLLKKIEELTLYIIDQQKQIDELKICIQK